MVSEIKFSSKAERDFVSIIEYLENNWSLTEIRRFNKIFKKRIQTIKLFPYSYPSLSNRNNIRKCVLMKQITLYYRINENEIIILSLYDSRQNPSKLKV
ncbi:MAG: type II toxin-antitoxin system RelE/ParE family toxin [Ignavibacteria bacterium]|nr:type II toxin-antitoxin system RelE/ParE family toxin [Ignavibacteria bacterium]MCC7159599.1 type II toxin-antitoxin system RelE/ParE family toxin [Ignavibacteria bacterium]